MGIPEQIETVLNPVADDGKERGYITELTPYLIMISITVSVLWLIVELRK